MRSIICFLLLASAAVLVAGHGYQIDPPSRNHLRNQGPAPAGIIYNQMNGNGRSSVMGTAGAFPIREPGPCGDPFQSIVSPADANYMVSLPWGSSFPAGRTAPVYTAGQTVRLSSIITANHGGYVAYKLCPRRDITNPTDLQACFDQYPLRRADGLGRQTYIFSPVYSPPAPGLTMTQDYVLPAGVSCPNGCLLQWEYYTFNTCFDPVCDNPTACGVYVSPAPGRNPVPETGNLVRQDCTSTTRPERFHNCADIIITSGGCTGTCATPTNACQTGGGCNAATRTCNPITNVADGTACPSGTCRSGMCQQTTGCPTTCPMPTNSCQQGGGCNAATRTCNPVTFVPNGIPCSGGTCQNGVCRTTGGGRCPRTAAPGGSCGATVGGQGGTCCPSGQCCSQWGWCGITATHCTGNCQPAFSGSGAVCNGAVVASLTGHRTAANTTDVTTTPNGIAAAASVTDTAVAAAAAAAGGVAPIPDVSVEAGAVPAAAAAAAATPAAAVMADHSSSGLPAPAAEATAAVLNPAAAAAAVAAPAALAGP